jgi:ABC-2 type transport system permease protein
VKKFWIIFRAEYAQVVKKKSFIIGIILTPMFMVGISIIPGLLATKKATEPETVVVIDQSGKNLGSRFAEAISGYMLEDSTTPYYSVKEIRTVPVYDTAGFASVQNEIYERVNSKDVKFALVFLKDAHLVDSNVYMISNSESFRTSNRFESKIGALLSAIRLEQSEINLPIDSVVKLTRTSDLNIRDATGETVSFGIKWGTSMVFMGILMSMVIGFGTLVMRSVIDEKNSRIMEVLVSSVTPFELMMGKILGLAGAAFTQISVWLLMGGTFYSLKGQLNIEITAVDRIIFNPVVLSFFVLFMISGYILFSTLFALVGSIVNSEKEAASFVFPITMCNVLPFIMGIYVIQEPNSSLVLALSLIPFFTPSLMMMRIIFVAPSMTEYSLFSGIVGEAILGLLIVCATTVGVIWLTAKVFRVGILMYGKRPTLPEIVKWIKY